MLVLASSSPRRQELLRNAGFEFTVQPANIPEELQEGERPNAFAERLAREKAQTVFQKRPNDTILGADTIVNVEGEILGKPRDNADAQRMLKLLSGRTHQVTTGVCLIGAGFCDARSETTSVQMIPFSAKEIASYVATGECLDKAGAYPIQGFASRWISRIEGDYFNVVGLPVSLVYRMLREHGAV
ncbi:MAG TPA: Maf family protein [Terriglobales bacterium]|nr:Maf family protein [Terriglobales bacterium]